MKLQPMRFDGYTWHHNPKNLSITSKKHIVTLHPPFSEPDAKEFGDGLKIISGEGELFGEDCLLQFGELKTLFEKGGRGVLSIPKTLTVYAYFEKLEFIGEPRENVLSYAFSFKEARNESLSGEDRMYHQAEEGETLWDIAYRFDEPIETLVTLNPQIRLLDELEKGETVRIC